MTALDVYIDRLGVSGSSVLEKLWCRHIDAMERGTVLPQLDIEESVMLQLAIEIAESGQIEPELTAGEVMQAATAGRLRLFDLPVVVYAKPVVH